MTSHDVMKNFYLEFEKPLQLVDEQISALTSISELSKDQLSSLSFLKEEKAFFSHVFKCSSTSRIKRYNLLNKALLKIL